MSSGPAARSPWTASLNFCRQTRELFSFRTPECQRKTTRSSTSPELRPVSHRALGLPGKVRWAWRLLDRGSPHRPRGQPIQRCQLPHHEPTWTRPVRPGLPFASTRWSSVPPTRSPRKWWTIQGGRGVSRHDERGSGRGRQRPVRRAKETGQIRDGRLPKQSHHREISAKDRFKKTRLRET